MSCIFPSEQLLPKAVYAVWSERRCCSKMELCCWKVVKLRMDKNFYYTFSLFADGSLSPLACIRPFAREGL